MSKSRARFLSELLGTTGLVKKAKSALAGADEVIDLDALPSIPNSKLTNSSITINSSATSLGGSITLTTANVAENTNLYYTDARADARIAAATTDDLSEGSSNLYYTDARADARVALIVDSAPGTLNTLNELAAALGDDANFSTTVTNSIATKLPLAGGTITGTVVFNSAPTFNTAIAMGSTLNVATSIGIAGTTVIDSNRNLTNIGTISSGAITSTGNVKGASLETNHTITFDYNDHFFQAGTGSVYLKDSGGSSLGGITSNGFNTGYNYQVGGTTVIDSSRNLTNIASVSASGAVYAGSFSSGYSVAFTNGNTNFQLYNNTSDNVLYMRDTTNGQMLQTWYTDKVVMNKNLQLSGTLRIGNTTVIDSSRNLTNIGTIASDNITVDDRLVIEGAAIYDNATNGNNKGFRIGGAGLVPSNGSGTQTNNLVDIGTNTYKFKDGYFSGTVDVGSLEIGGQTVIDSGRNLTNIGTIGSGAITSTGAVTGTYFSDGYVTWNAAQFNRSGAAIEFQFTPTSSAWKVKIGANGDNPTEFNAYTGDADFSGEVSTPSAKLKAIAESNTDTAVDVFVYDTRKDSDGGAWRKRTQHTSWYNETLNTSTRGARKEFPSVAVIVVASNDVIIYDGDDPDMPMWMVFPADAYITWASTTDTGTSCVSALNSKLFIGNSNGYGDCIVDFVSDDTRLVYNNNNYALTKRTVVDRNILESTEYPLYYSGGDGYNIVNNAINDVAMTVLPNAPIDADTGLPVPTIAVATDGGVSIIKDDGTVVDIVSDTLAHETPREVKFVDDKVFWLAGNNYDNAWSSVNSVKIPSGDITTPYNSVTTANDLVSKYTPKEWNVTNHAGDLLIPINMLSPRTGALIELTKDDELIIGGEGSDDHGTVVKVVENVSDPESGMLAQIASDFNTGYQVGDIKLAALSDTDTTNATDSNVVNNGTFSSNTNDWSGDSGAAISWDSGGFASVGNGGGDNTFAIKQTGILVSGAKYRITGRVQPSMSGNYTFRIRAGGSSVQWSISSGLTNGQWYSFDTGIITADGTSLEIGSQSGTMTSFYLDDVYVWKLEEEDRSWNNTGLEVHGTVTKTAVATGAELVAYSGFSTSNYLQQPYNADLQFGTGDFSIACWVKAGTTNAYRRFISIQDPSGNQNNNDAINIKYAPPSNGFIYAYLGSTEGSITTAANIPANTWQQVILLRLSGIYYLYLDGRLVSTKASTQTKGSTSHVLRVGGGVENNEPFSDGSISLVRIAKTAPTAEQIAKMYNDEKHLFATNAKATIAGTSDAVTALAYDDDTELLHVGSSWGRSVFQGLNRVEYSTDVVTTAISASNGFIAED